MANDPPVILELLVPSAHMNLNKHSSFGGTHNADKSLGLPLGKPSLCEQLQT